MLLTTGEEHLIVYIGGKAEDVVPARAADLVLARGALRACCQRENISFTPVDSPAAAAACLDLLFARPRLHKRWMAEQHRRSLFMAEA
jgi:2-hydroxy-3-keto-5-methylthiopentenyl-1-phosphate phosphatase